MSDRIHIDVSELRQLSTALKKVEPKLQKQFFKDLNAGGQIVAARAKANASFSSRIPKTIKVRRRGVSVSVVAGGPGAPDAAPFENRGESGTFRHPVFGNTQVWVDQQAHPFLAPAGRDSIPQVVGSIRAGVDTAFKSAGL